MLLLFISFFTYIMGFICKLKNNESIRQKNYFFLLYVSFENDR